MTAAKMSYIVLMLHNKIVNKCALGDKATKSMTNDHKSGVSSVKVKFKKVILSLYWLIYFK